MLEKVRVMALFDGEGREIWREGEGGLCLSAVRSAVDKGSPAIYEDIPTEGGPETAVRLLLKTVVVVPIEDRGRRYYLYFDSGSVARFSWDEIWQLVGIGRWKIREKEKEKEKEKELGLRFIGKSRASERVRRKIIEASEGEGNVLIEGESGVGKGLVAELIYQLSGAKGQFVSLNCASIPSSLFESELFGHRKGAYTDAKEEKVGLVERARGGVLFLDEITEIPLEVQAKLLHFVESGYFRRLGDFRERKVKVRIISASNRNISDAIRRGLLREDLYYRLSVYHIKIPPLRERPQDIESLLEYYGGFLGRRRLSGEAVELIKGYSFPGNCRQLINLLRRLGSRRGPLQIGAGEVEEELGEFPQVFMLRSDEIDALWRRIEEGGNFWEVVKKPFLSRDLNRAQVKEFLRRGLVKAGGKWKRLCEIINLPPEEYHKFMTFLHDYKLKP